MAVNIKDIYQTCKLLSEKMDTIEASGGTIDEGLKEDLITNFTDVIKFEEMHLFMAHDKYYGYVLSKLITEVNLEQNGPTDLKFESGGKTIMSFNPRFICKEYKYSEFTGLVISEILRLSLGHPASFAELNPETDGTKHQFLEMASSASIAEMVKSDIRLGSNGSNNSLLRLPNDAYTPGNINKDCGVAPKDKQSIEYYYSVLNKFYKRDKSNPNSGMVRPGGFVNNNQPGKGTSQQVHNWEKKDSDSVREEIKNIVSEAFNALSEKEKGNMPGFLVQEIKKLLAPPQINWKQILRKMIGSVPVPYRKTRLRLNRRQPYRADLCGRLPKRTVNVLCAIDTSGSMSERDIQYCLNEVFNIVKDYEGSKVTIIECDMNINNIYTAKKIQDVHTKVGGRGGTSFLPVIEFINGDIKDSKWKNHPQCGKFRDAVMIYFTDGYGDYEIPKPQTYRNLWVVLNGENNLSLKQPYGDVKSLSTDKDYMKMKNGY